MTEEELETLLGAKMKSCVAGRQMPDDSADRLITQMRRARRTFRRRAATFSVLAGVLSALLLGALARPEPKPPAEAALIAARPTSSGEKVSGWMLIGVFRECFKRNKTNKRKEED